MTQDHSNTRRSTNLPRTSTRAGSHAGRGFRYQDAAAAWLAVQCWAGNLSYGSVTPEGLDDAELNGPDGRVFVQMKSRRDQLGSYGRGIVAAHLRDLWTRASAAPSQPEELILVLERDVDGIEIQHKVATPLADLQPLMSLVGKHKFAGNWIERTRILIAPNPMESAIDLLVQKLGCIPMMAAIYFATIADKVGNLSDDNGIRRPGEFLSLSVSDLEHEIKKLAGILSAADLDSAIRRGLCEPVDFLTPLKDANFYLGVDVQPGHISAGLLSERPEARMRVLNALERQRAVLISGPSGSGKSGLMWEAARESRHTIRWFRVQNAVESDVVELLRLADTFRATAHMPIGFVLDDVGRHRSGLWDVLAAEAATRHNVLLLGSLREEDMFLVARRSLSIEIREQPDVDLAERIWYELKDRGQTGWPGWREPWQICNGLLLEYTHLLTQDRRLLDVLRDQIDRRVREKRYVELAVLRVTSLAGQTGGAVDLTRLRHTLALNDDDLSVALKRLIDEHLIQRVKSGERLASLHQIRATALVDITHEIPPPLKSETVKQAVLCIAPEDLEGFITRTLARDPALAGGILDGAVERMHSDGCFFLLASIVRGLDAGSIGDTVERWLSHLDHLEIPPTQATMVAMLALANTEPFLKEKLKAHFEAARLLRDMVHHDHRRVLIERLELQLFTLLSEEPDWCAVTALLAGLLGASLPSSLKTRLAELKPDLLAMPLKEAVELLETTGLVEPTLASIWVNKVGQSSLLERLMQEIPWVSPVEFRNEPEGLAVCSDIFYISDQIQGDLHEDVVNLCKKLFAFAPSADLAISSAIAPDGKPVEIGGIRVATKRIHRANLPAGALPARNNRWITAIAQRVAPDGLSQYLAKSKQLLDALVPLLEKLINGVVRGKPRIQYLDRLGAIYDASRNLIRPPDPETISEGNPAIGVSNLQNILNHCSANLLRGLIELPERAVASYALATDILMQIDKACIEEPWTLIGDGPPPSLAQLREIIEQSRIIIGEAGFRNLKPSQLVPSFAKSAMSNNVLRMLSLRVKQKVDGRLKALDLALEAISREHGYNVRTTSRPVDEIGGSWPYAETLVVVMLERMEDWLTALAALAQPLREVWGEGRRISIIPAVAGFTIPDQAISGVETLFPQPFRDVAWLETIGLPSAETPLARTFDLLAAALLEVSAITVFDCAGDGRSSEEASTLLKSLATIESARAELEHAIPAEESEVLMVYLDQLLTMRPNLAIEFWQHMRGSIASEALAILSVLKLIIVDLDIRNCTAH